MVEKTDNRPKYGIFYVHNHRRLKDLEILRDYYYRQGNLARYIIPLTFWYYAYTLLVSWGNREYAEEKTLAFLFACEYEGIFNPIKTDQFEKVWKAYEKGHAYTLSNDSLPKIFPVAKALSLATAKKLTEKERSRLRRVSERLRKEAQGETKKAKINKRRELVLHHYRMGCLYRQIADKLEVSLSTIEKDIKALYEKGRILSRRLRRGHQNGESDEEFIQRLARERREIYQGVCSPKSVPGFKPSLCDQS